MIKHYLSRLIGCAALTLAAAGLGGCPSPVLQVSPGALDFGNAIEASIRIANIGGGTLNWTLTEVSRATAESPWIDTELNWLTARTTSGAQQSGLLTVKLDANTSLLPVGTTSNVGVRIESNGGSAVVPLSITVEPTLLVSPASINLPPGSLSASFSISNIGTQTANWSVLFLADPDDVTSGQPIPDGLIVTPASGAANPGNTATVTVNWTGERDDFALFVQSPAGSSRVRFNIGSVLTTLTATPSPLSLFFNNEPVEQSGGGTGTAEQVESTLRITNNTGAAISWNLQAVNRLNPGGPVPILLSAQTGSAPGNGESAVQVSVDSRVNPANVLTGSGNYELLLTSGDGFIVIPVVIELLKLPEIAISEPPNDSQGRPEIVALDLLDLGRESVQGEFWIANVGPRGSRLSFRITHEDQGVADPLLISVNPLTGTLAETGNDFVFPGGNFRIDGIPVTVLVDRSKMVEDVEFRTITIEAVNNGTVLDPVEKKTVQVRVERAPLKIEGAINRSRPPYLMRFVFLLRDSLGQVIPASEEGVLDRLTFNISENEGAIDLNETNFFVEGPEGLKTNMVLMLDYTGSMYRLGTSDPQNPLAPGEAVEQVKQAAKAFVKDLPEGYRLQVMYYNDRQQRNRVIHPFSSDRESIITAIDRFSLPPALFGVSTIRDALGDAIVSLAAEDAANVLPFDDADVRAVVYVTDGVDNASILTESDITGAADEARVRLYPLLYNAGGAIGGAQQLVLAEESGGHLYTAPRLASLLALLANRQGIELEALEASANNTARVRVTNLGTGETTWRATIQEGGFITQVTPQESINQASGIATTLTLQFNPAGLVANEVAVGKVLLSTAPDTGSGEITVSVLPTLSGGNLVILPENVSLNFRDPTGEVWRELSNQVVMTYVTPAQAGGDYNVQITYAVTPTQSITGSFEEDGVFSPGDVLAGQIALSSAGIMQDPGALLPEDRTRAEIYVRADYVPRDVTSFRMRFLATPAPGIPAAAAAALAQAQTRVELAPDGLLIADNEFESSWRLLAEGDGIFRMRTEGSNDLLYGSFGRLLKVTINNLGPFVAAFSGTTRQPEFLFEMRVDNDQYYLPAGGGLPSRTKYFLYPGGPAFLEEGAGFPGNRLSVLLEESALAGPAPSVLKLQNPGFDPELAFPWDLDADGVGDFQDPEPLSAAIPSGLVIPSSFEIGAGVNQFQLLLRNNRLDTFTWAVDAASLPSWISSVTSTNGPGALAPGEEDTITVTVNRAGFSDVVLRGGINIVTDLFGVEEVELTLVVPPAP